MKIGTKLSISFSCILILMVMIAGLFIWSQKQSASDSEKMLFAYTHAINLKDISWAISRQINDGREITVNDSENVMSDFLKQTDEVIYHFEKLENLVRKETLTAKSSADKERVKNENTEIADLKGKYLSLITRCEKILEKKNSQKIEDFNKLIETEFDGNLSSGLKKAVAAAEYDSSITKQNAYSRQVYVERISWAILAFGIFTTIFLSILIGRTISEPIANLRTAAEKIGAGDLETRIEINSKDEIGQLAKALHKMAENLKRSMDSLSEELSWHTRVEEQYKQVAEKFEKVNSELKEFAYIVSHDLKAPLRGIKTIATWLAEDYAEKFDDNGKEQLSLLVSRVDMVHGLIEGVLEYSRIGRIKEQEVNVNLNEVAAEVIEKTESPANIEIQIEDRLPEVICEKIRMAQVFENLISNAVKFMDKQQGWIKIRCADRQDFWEISVEDNGPGIEERHFERIFKIFQKLSAKKNDESAGIGLTLAKKIVEIYGGKIWVESKVGQGSKFIFTLRKPAGAVNKQELVGAASQK